MSLLIKNIDTVNVELDDLGITLTPNEEYDLVQDDPRIVATSLDLPTAISGGLIRVLDPLDNVTQLTLSQSLEAIASHNDAHYRIRGGELTQLDDITLTTPTTGDVLYYNGAGWINQTLTTTDELVKVSANDTTAGYLNGKLVAGTGISLTENNNGGDETLTITNNAPNVDQNVFTTFSVAGQNDVVADTTTDTLTLVAGTNITITTDAATDSITITGANQLQNIFETVAADTGTAVADTTTDTLTISGGLGIATSADGGTDTVTIDLNANLDDLLDVNAPTPVDGDVLYYNGIAGEWQNQTLFVPGQGKIVQVQFGPIPAVSGTATIPYDATTPQITEGVQIWSSTITPTSTTSKIRITTSVAFAVSRPWASSLVVAVFRDNTCVGVMSDTAARRDSLQTVTFTVYDTPTTTTAVTYSARVGRSSGNSIWYINQDANITNVFGGLLAQNAYTVEEIGI